MIVEMIRGVICKYIVASLYYFAIADFKATIPPAFYFDRIDFTAYVIYFKISHSVKQKPPDYG